MVLLQKIKEYWQAKARPNSVTKSAYQPAFVSFDPSSCQVLQPQFFLMTI
jgi:hypothetical protein